MKKLYLPGGEPVRVEGAEDGTQDGRRARFTPTERNDLVVSMVIGAVVFGIALWLVAGCVTPREGTPRADGYYRMDSGGEVVFVPYTTRD